MPRTNKRINYVEFAVTDIARAKAFYGQAFGWKFTDYGPDYCEFDDGHMTGGFARYDQLAPIQTGGPLIILYSTDLQAQMTDIIEAGGIISEPIFDFPGGQRFHFNDPEGYELAVWHAPV